MQDKTGTLNPGAHPGSYNGQDAYNDMLVVDDGYKHEQSKLSLHSKQGQSSGVSSVGLQRPSDSFEGGCKMTTVRRLTPLECERLQGFPDGWTDIGEWTDTKGKLHKESSDSARYKALGNSIALPFWDWMLGRISAQYDRPATLGSLFDGIGGFPLCWEHHNGKGSAIWASEIEEFPIAVTKKHFKEEQ